jgi:hypothetical protein
MEEDRKGRRGRKRGRERKGGREIRPHTPRGMMKCEIFFLPNIKGDCQKLEEESSEIQSIGLSEKVGLK